MSASPFALLERPPFVVEPLPQAAKKFWKGDELLFEELDCEKRSFHPTDVEFVLAPVLLEKIDHEKGSLPLLEVDGVFELEDVVAVVANTAGVAALVVVAGAVVVVAAAEVASMAVVVAATAEA